MLLLDARPTEDYEAGHIPGAVSLPAFSLDGSGEGADSLGPIEDVTETFQQAGVRMSQAIVVYDGAVDHRPASRLFWALEVHGHPRVAVLNGGLPAWQRETGSSLSTEFGQVEPSEFSPVLQPSRLATQLQVIRSSVTSSTLLLDTRSRAEYVGSTSSGVRSGHIEGAAHLDFSDNLVLDTNAESCHIRPLGALLELYSEIPENKPLITYCNTGTHASVSYLALRALGREVAVYDGGWLEWANDPRLPIRTGPSP